MRSEFIPFMPLWRALRHYSLTFSIVFASAILGVSVISYLRLLLRQLSAPWLLLWIIPILLVGAAAKREDKWIPDPNLRRQLATALVLGSLAISIASTFLRDTFFPPEPQQQIQPAEPQSPTRDHRPRPRGK